jgi:hypothetical protein
MEYSQIAKNQIIQNYISQVDFKNGNFSVKQMKYELKNLLQEEPAINIGYVKEKMLMEDFKTEKVVEKVETITIYYSDGYDNNNKIITRKIELYV